jgi:hypothetical protein
MARLGGVDGGPMMPGERPCAGRARHLNAISAGNKSAPAASNTRPYPEKQWCQHVHFIVPFLRAGQSRRRQILYCLRIFAATQALRRVRSDQ